MPAANEAQQTGYNIKRNEFEPEYDAEAETIISELADYGLVGGVGGRGAAAAAATAAHRTGRGAWHAL